MELGVAKRHELKIKVFRKIEKKLFESKRQHIYYLSCFIQKYKYSEQNKTFEHHATLHKYVWGGSDTCQVIFNILLNTNITDGNQNREIPGVRSTSLMRRRRKQF